MTQHLQQVSSRPNISNSTEFQKKEDTRLDETLERIWADVLGIFQIRKLNPEDLGEQKCGICLDLLNNTEEKQAFVGHQLNETDKKIDHLVHADCFGKWAGRRINPKAFEKSDPPNFVPSLNCVYCQQSKKIPPFHHTELDRKLMSWEPQVNEISFHPYGIKLRFIYDFMQLTSKARGFQFISKEKSEYIGSFVNWIREGHGICINEKKDIWKGQWHNGMMHGKGTTKNPDGGTYEGEWQNNQRHGKGTQKMSNGHKYDGEWQQDKRHGNGTYYYGPDGGTYEGEWQNNQRHGKGTVKKSNGHKYDGEWQQDKRHGNGTYYGPDWGTYEGEWQNNQRHGKGTQKMSNGHKYEGEWQQDKRHGNGTYYRPDWGTYEGEWREGKLHGKGTKKNPDGGTYQGQWQQGKLLQ